MANDISLKIGVEGEKQFRQDMKNIDAQVKSTGATVKQLSAEYDKNNKSVETLNKKQQALSKGIEQNRSKVNLLTTEYDKQNKKLKDLGSALEKAKKENGENSQEAQKAEAAYKKQETACENLKTQIAKANTEIEKQGKELEQTNAQYKQATDKVKIFGDAMQTAGTKLSAVGDKIAGVGSKLTLGITTPLVTLAGTAVKTATDAETSFAKVLTIIDRTKMSYDELRKSVIAASDETGTSVTDFNEALYSSISAGVDTANAVSFTNDMVKLAKGGFTDTAKAVDVVTTVLNAYGMENSKAADVCDRLINTQNLGKTTVDELASSLGKVIPTANAAGVGFDEVSATMADLTKNGIATAESTTYFNSMLNELNKSGTTADVMLRSISDKNFKQLIASGKNITDVLKLLDEGARLTNVSLSDMFGSAEAGKAALVLMKDGGIEYNSILKSMQTSAGATQKAFEQMDATPAQQMQKELNKVKNIGIDMGNKLLPVVTKGLKSVDSLISSYGKLNDGTKDTILKMGGIAAAAGPVIGVGGKLISGIGKVTKGIGTMIKGIAALPPPAGIAVAAAAALAGIGTAAFAAYKKMEQAEIDKHFGKIKLSAEQVEDVAKRLTTTEWNMKLDATIEAKSKVAELQKQLEDTVVSINTTQYKLSIGLQLTDGEKEQYKNDIASYIQHCNDYVSQNGYAINLALKATFGEDNPTGNALGNFTDNYTKEANAELTRLGKELSDIVNYEFSNDCLGSDEAYINNITEKMNSILQEIKDAEYEAELGDIELSYNTDNFGIDKDSFDRLNEKISADTQELIDKGEENRKQALVGINLQYKENLKTMPKEAADQIYNNAKSQLETAVRGQQADAIEVGFNFAFNTVNKNFETELNATAKGFDNLLSNFTAASEESFQGAIDTLSVGMPQLTGAAKKTVQDMLKSLAPQEENLKTMRDACLAAGQSVPENITKGINDIEKYKAMLGDTDGLYSVLAQQIAESPQAQEAILNAQAQGAKIPEELGKAIAANAGMVYKDGQLIGANALAGAKAEYDGKNVGTATGNVKLNTAGVAEKAISEIQWKLNSQGVYVNVQARPGDGEWKGFATGGIIDHPTLAVMGEEYKEAVIPLSSARRAQATALLDKVTEMIGYDTQYSAATGHTQGQVVSQKASRTTNRNITMEKGSINIEIHTPSTNTEELYSTIKRRLDKDVFKNLQAMGA